MWSVYIVDAHAVLIYNIYYRVEPFYSIIYDLQTLRVASTLMLKTSTAVLSVRYQMPAVLVQ